MQEEFDRENVRQATILLLAVFRYRQRVFEKLIKDMGMSNSQHRLLMHLYRTDCAPSQTELAHTFEVSTAAMAVALKRLEKGGYIRRCAAIDNTRYNEIALTDKGLDIVQKTHHMFTAVDMTALNSFSDAELEGILSCLSTMKTTLEALESEKQELPGIKGIHVREIMSGVDKATGVIS